MDLRPAEVTSILEKEIEEFSQDSGMQSVGTVLSVGDGVARVYGLDDCVMNELLEFEGGVRGVALNLEEDNVGCVLLGSATEVKEGQQVKGTGRIISVPTGDKLLGRVVNALGDAVDGKGPLGTSESDLRPIEQDAPSVVERQPVDQPLQTGIKAIDAMIPIGRGQRELIIGDRQTGKTALLVDTILSQKTTGGGDPTNPEQVICIYVAVGQKQSTVVDIVRRLESEDAMKYTIVVSASAIDEASMQYLACYAGCAMGERFRDEGRHVVIFYDDLYKQALAYRQVMLLLRRPPGREAFPGDVVGLVNATGLNIGDSLFDETGPRVKFPPIPSFAPEVFATARPVDTGKSKQFRKGLAQLNEEGVVQVLKDPDWGDASPVLAAVGQLQFDVFANRLEFEFNAPIEISPAPYQAIRVTDKESADKLREKPGVRILARFSGDMVALFENKYALQRIEQNEPELTLEPIVAG